MFGPSFSHWDNAASVSVLQQPFFASFQFVSTCTTLAKQSLFCNCDQVAADCDDLTLASFPAANHHRQMEKIRHVVAHFSKKQKGQLTLAIKNRRAADFSFFHSCFPFEERIESPCLASLR